MNDTDKRLAAAGLLLIGLWIAFLPFVYIVSRAFIEYAVRHHEPAGFLFAGFFVLLYVAGSVVGLIAMFEKEPSDE